MAGVLDGLELADVGQASGPRANGSARALAPWEGRAKGQGSGRLAGRPEGG